MFRCPRQYVSAHNLTLASPPALNIPRPPTLNFPNLKSISVWKSTINFIFPGYIMPHFCQYKRKRKCLLKHYLYFSSLSMECRYYLLCHFIKKCSCTEIHLISWNSFFQSVLCDIFLSNYYLYLPMMKVRSIINNVSWFALFKRSLEFKF